MKVRITTIDEGKPEVTEHETALNLHQFILADMGLYKDMDDLKSDFDHAELKENSVLLKNETYQHTYEVVCP